MKFPELVMRHLEQHKSDMPSEIRAHQVARAAKQAGTLRGLFHVHTPLTMLDIGCGLALASIMLVNDYWLTGLHLMDGDGSGEVFHDYRAGAPAWNDVQLAGIMARENVRGGCTVVEHPADPNLTISVDLIVSFKSWGTHYPISTYLPLAVRSLKPGGLVAVDLHPSELMQDDQAIEFEDAGFDLIERHKRRHVFQCR